MMALHAVTVAVALVLMLTTCTSCFLVSAYHAILPPSSLAIPQQLRCPRHAPARIFHPHHRRALPDHIHPNATQTPPAALPRASSRARLGRSCFSFCRIRMHA